MERGLSLLPQHDSRDGSPSRSHRALWVPRLPGRAGGHLASERAPVPRARDGRRCIRPGGGRRGRSTGGGPGRPRGHGVGHRADHHRRRAGRIRRLCPRRSRHRLRGVSRRCARAPRSILAYCRHSNPSLRGSTWNCLRPRGLTGACPPSIECAPVAIKCSSRNILSHGRAVAATRRQAVVTSIRARRATFSWEDARAPWPARNVTIPMVGADPKRCVRSVRPPATRHASPATSNWALRRPCARILTTIRRGSVRRA